MLKTRIVEAIQDIALKKATLTIRDLRRLLFRLSDEASNNV